MHYLWCKNKIRLLQFFAKTLDCCIIFSCGSRTNITFLSKILIKQKNLLFIIYIRTNDFYFFSNNPCLKIKTGTLKTIARFTFEFNLKTMGKIVLL